MTIRIPTHAEALNYEIRSSWWAGKISYIWAQKLAAIYFAWKVNSKLAKINGDNSRWEEIKREMRPMSVGSN